jgi:adenylyl-sulfate kinase
LVPGMLACIGCRGVVFSRCPAPPEAKFVASNRPSRTRNPIFIQAMWRTASTYVWQKFRVQPQYRAYYEPLHEMLVKPRDQVLSIGDHSRTAVLRHPPIDHSYFSEFPFGDKGGVEFFEKPLSYERYCLQDNETDDALNRYISRLISYAALHKQRAVLQFNRGLLRAGWLTRNFSPVNILVLRRPASVWKSFLSFADDSFAGILCIVLGQNKFKRPLQSLPDWLDLPCRIGATIEDDYGAYGSITAELKRRMYPSFFDFYLVATLHCVRYADCILDVDELSVNPAARTAAQDRLRRFGIEIDLSDCAVPSYSLASAEQREWLAYEDFARRFLRATIPPRLLLSRKAIQAHLPMLGGYFRALLGEFAGRDAAKKSSSSLDVAARAAGKHVEGLRLFHDSHQDASAQTLGEALAEQPNSERWNDWATAQAACSRLILAELGYKQALKMDLWNCEAAGNLGAVLASLGRYSEALPLLEQVVRAAPDGATGGFSELLMRVRKSIGAEALPLTDILALQRGRPTAREGPTVTRSCRGITIFFTGLSGAGKSSLAAELRTTLLAMSVPAVTVLDGDSVREHLSSELGFSKDHRDLNVRRIGFVAAEVTRHGGIAVCAAIAPFDAARRQVRAMVEPLGAFVLVHVATPLSTCEQRDCKGLYAKARAGTISQFTGISDPYEEPLDAEIRIDTSLVSVEQGTRKIVSYLASRQLIPSADSALLSGIGVG